MAARARKLAALRTGLAALLGIVTSVALGCGQASPTPGTSQRIVSLVPSVTEMLFAIGAGAQVVGVSSYDRFPPEVESLPKVGALLDPDTERILSLRPDMVVVYGSQTDTEARFKKAGIRTFSYRHGANDAIKGTFDTITALGAATGHETQAREVVARVSTQLDALRMRVAGRDRPKTLLVIGRQPGTLQGLYAAGGSGFLNEMLEIAGGENVFADVNRESVQPSTETLLSRAPALILELSATAPAGDYPGGGLEVWDRLASIPAVRERQLHSIVGDFVVVAGPRLAEGAEAIAKVLHPEAFK